PKGDEIVTYRVEADLKATRYVTVRVSEGGTPVPEAQVTVGGKEEGVTDAKGEFVYSYRTQPPKGAELGVAKTGFSPYRATRQLEPPGSRSRPQPPDGGGDQGDDRRIRPRERGAGLEREHRRQDRGKDRRAGQLQVRLPRRAGQEGPDRARGAGLRSRSVENHGPARRPNQPSALLLPDCAQADPHRTRSE